MKPLYKQTLWILNIFSLIIAFSLSAQESVSKKKSQTLFPDDISTPTRWILDPSHPKPDDIPEDLFTNSDGSIRERHYYRPAIVTDVNALIVFIVVHGTWGTETQSYFENDNDNDKKEQHYNHIKRFASQLSTTKRKNLELLSFLWSGSLSDKSRKLPGEVLNRLMTSVRSYENAETVLLGHSHGCNVINYYSRIVNPEKPISLLIYFACPRRKEEHYQPLYYKTLLYFYSDSDLTTIAGRANETESAKTGTKVLVGIGAAEGTAYYLGNKTLVHIPGTNIKITGKHVRVAIYLSTFLFATKKIKDSVSGSNNFPGKDGKITVGFRTKINGKNPWHSTIIDVTRLLPEIIKKVLTRLPAHYSDSSDFHLNIDLEDTADPVYLAPLSKEIHIAPQQFDSILLENEDGSCKIIDSTSIPRGVETREKEWADTELARYTNKYQKDLTSNYLKEKIW